MEKRVLHLVLIDLNMEKTISLGLVAMRRIRGRDETAMGEKGEKEGKEEGEEEGGTVSDTRQVRPDMGKVGIVGIGERGAELIPVILDGYRASHLLRNALLASVAGGRIRIAAAGSSITCGNTPDVTGREEREGTPREDWLDRPLLLSNPAYKILRGFDTDMVRRVSDIVKRTDVLFLISDLEDDDTEICLLFDALCTKYDKRDIIFLIRSDVQLGFGNYQYINKQIQNLGVGSDGVILVPGTDGSGYRGFMDILSGLYHMIYTTGMVNIDLADIKNITGFGNVGMMGVGRGSGLSRINNAIESVLKHPMLDVDLEHIKRAIICVCGGEDMTMEESEKCSVRIADKLRDEAKIIWGAYISPEMEGMAEILLLVALTPNQALLHHAY